jgi:hypothetical protein
LTECSRDACADDCAALVEINGVVAVDQRGAGGILHAADF